MIRFIKVALILAGLSVLLFSVEVFAQTGTTSVQGTVVDNSGAAVVAAKVVVKNVGQALEREMQTNTAGEYKFLALPPGTYTITAEKEGFRRYESRDVSLLVDLPVTLDVKLTVGGITEKVEVSGQAEAVNTTDASLGLAFGENAIKQLPLESRNVPDLLSLQAGVVYTGNSPDIDTSVDTRSGSVNGSHSDQSNVTVDGISVNDKGGHAFTSVLPVTLDSVQEFRVTTSNYGADEGASSGAQVTLVTKSGTDSFHGSLYEYNRNSYVSANEYFIKQAQLQSSQPNLPPQLNRNIFGASVGGPILKNRLYFFLNYEGYRDAEAVSALRTVPTASMRDGVIEYLCQTNADGSPNTGLCPGNTVSGLSGASYTAPAGYEALSPKTITNMDSTSLGPHGPDPVVVQYMKSTYPLPNDSTTGDLVNTAGFRFRGATHYTKNWYIGKLDFNVTKDGKQRVSLSGALANESNPQAPFLPGTVPEETILGFNKGLIASHTWVISPTLLNYFRYGFIRESQGLIGDSNQPWNQFIVLSQGIYYSSSFQRPIHNFNDDMSWARGKHTWQFGTQIGLLRTPESNTNLSFSSGVANPDWLQNSGLSTNISDPMNPSYVNPQTGLPAYGLPGVDSSFVSNYDYPMVTLLGMISLVNANYNYQRNGQALSQGTPVTRRFGEDSYEVYAQDSWKFKPNLTLNLGLRYSLFSPPWETNGLQVAPTVSLNTWFNNRRLGMYQGLPSTAQPPIAYNWSGPANGGGPGYYSWDYHDLAPRVSFAYSPDWTDGTLGKIFGGPGKTSIRGGFAMLYDRVGESIADTFDQNGSFGLSTQLQNESDIETSVIAPRIADMHAIPQKDYAGNQIFTPAPAGTFPAIFPSVLAITWGIDDKLKTPYSYNIDFAVSRDLGSKFTLETAYVGRLSRRQLAQDDMAMPLDIYDKASGLDYFAAETALAKVFRPQLNAGNNAATLSFDPSQVPANVRAFWTNQIQPLVAGGAYTINGCTGGNSLGTTSPVVAAFDVFCATQFNDSLGLYNLDIGGIPDFNNSNQVYFPIEGQNTYYSQQYSSLYAWRSMASASYHALQVSLRHGMSHGVQFDFNYTFSKSIDLASDAERIAPASSISSLNNIIINAWDPQQERGVSSYDATHQLNANWVAELPFGRGRPLGTGANAPLDAVIGGWQLSGIFRWTSGFPVNVDNGYSNFPTNFEQEGNANLVGHVKTGAYHLNTGPDAGNVNIFANGPAAINAFAPAYAGQSGQRDVIRGEGYFGIDMGLAKRWKMPFSEKQSLQFRWEVFNITNSAIFDVQSSLLSSALTLGSGGSFGNYSGMLNNPRIMEFALRYEF
jgi:hypothetical protein